MCRPPFDFDSVSVALLLVWFCLWKNQRKWAKELGSTFKARAKLLSPSLCFEICVTMATTNNTTIYMSCLVGIFGEDNCHLCVDCTVYIVSINSRPEQLASPRRGAASAGRQTNWLVIQRESEPIEMDGGWQRESRHSLRRCQLIFWRARLPPPPPPMLK